MFRRLIALALLLSLPAPAHAAGYLVRPGDSLSSIAAAHGMSVPTLARANAISNLNLVRIGEYLQIPQRMIRTWYRVQWGDTLIGIAAHNGTTVEAIRAANPRLGLYPLAGQWLQVCRGCSHLQTLTVAPASTASVRRYVVRPGDNLSSIAARFGVSTVSVSAANRISNVDVVVAGSALQIPTAFGGGVATATYDPWAARALIVHYAHLYGINPALPLGIGWQESGFNENMISGTGAIGVMQVEPYTGDTISNILGRRMNLHDVHDNVQAGVYWISNLLQYYAGNERLAVAAYYQGTRSLAHHGFYTDTYQYVSNVLALKARFGG